MSTIDTTPGHQSHELARPAGSTDPVPTRPNHATLSRARTTLHSVRTWWRTSARPRWQGARPAILLTTGLSVLVLGTSGYQTMKHPPGFNGILDSFFKAIGLFGLGGSFTGPVPTTLLIARVLGPLLTGYAALGTLLALFREQARVLSIRMFVRDHVVIAGLGTTGWRLAAALVDAEPVVVMESRANHERLPSARIRGLRVLIGQATDVLTLKRAGVQHARALVVACGGDGTNVDVATAASQLHRSRRRGTMTIFVHLRDLDLWSSLAAEAHAATTKPRVRVEYFNIFATAAQLMLEAGPPGGQLAQDFASGTRPHIMFVGLEGVGEQLLLQMARLWRAARAGDERLRVTVAGSGAGGDVNELRTRYPAIDELCELHESALPIDSAAFQSGALMLDAEAGPVTRAYVCLRDEGVALTAALALHARPDACQVPVTVAVEDERQGVGVLMSAEHGRFGNIEAYGLVAKATSGELLLRGTSELLARAQHAQWLRNELAERERRREQGESLEPNPNLVPWEQLSEDSREENRRFVDDLHEKLREIKAMLVPMPLRAPGQELFTFTPEELDRLSRHEHIRWMRSKSASGWVYGSPRDDKERIHPDLVPWEELTEASRDKDRNAVRELPVTLETAGFTIQRHNEKGLQG
jgi:voltage-gated potassium channel Kch